MTTMDTSSSTSFKLRLTIPVPLPTDTEYTVPIISGMVTRKMLNWSILGETVTINPKLFCLRVYLCCENKTSEAVDWKCKTSFKGQIMNMGGKEGQHNCTSEYEFTKAKKRYFWASLHNQLEDEEKGFIVNGEMHIEVEVTPQPPEGLSFDPSSIAGSTASHFLTSGEGADVVFLTADGGEVRAHRRLLASKSPVFGRMFEPHTKEAKSGIVEMNDMEAATMKAFLRFLYLGDYSVVDECTRAEEVMQLINAAEMYGFQELKKYCGFILVERVTGENVAECLAFATRYDLKDAEEGMLAFIGTKGMDNV